MLSLTTLICSFLTILICSFLTTVSSTQNCENIYETKQNIAYSSDQYVIDCSSIDKYILFAALYNHARPRGTGNMNAVREELMDRIKAKRKLDEWENTYYANIYFIDGMYMEVDFSNWPYINSSRYDARYGGSGTFESLYNELKERNDESIEITMFSKMNVSLSDIPNLKELTKVKFSQEVKELLIAYNKSNSDDWFIFEGINKYGSYQFISTAHEWIKFKFSLSDL